MLFWAFRSLLLMFLTVLSVCQLRHLMLSCDTCTSRLVPTGTSVYLEDEMYMSSSSPLLYSNSLRCSLMGLVPLHTKEPHINRRVPLGSFRWFRRCGWNTPRFLGHPAPLGAQEIPPADWDAGAHQSGILPRKYSSLLWLFLGLRQIYF